MQTFPSWQNETILHLHKVKMQVTSVKVLARQTGICIRKTLYNEQIMTPCQLYDWAKDSITYRLLILFIPQKKNMKTRIEDAKTEKVTFLLMTAL